MPNTLTVAPTDLAELEEDVDVLVLGVYRDEELPYLAPNLLSDDSAEAINEILEALGATGAPDQLLHLPGIEDVDAHTIALIGLGAKSESEAEHLTALRYGAGSAARQLLGNEKIAFDFGINTLAELEAVAHGATLGSFVEKGIRGKSAASLKKEIKSILIIAPVAPEDANESLHRIQLLGEATKATRHLVNTPPSHLYPEVFANTAQELAQDYKNIGVEVYNYDRLVKEGFGGIAGVGQGSPRRPALAVVKYAPENPTTSIGLVGKGITFDTGGNSLKPAASMMTMKCDMAGAAAVLQALLTVAALELPVAVTGYLCLAENMPGGYALRPEDVITIRDGRTVEVMNTDAEGRLVMADGIALASENQHDVIVDIATLTGAAMAALGLRTAGLMGDKAVCDRIQAAGAEAGETYWQMPLESHLRASMNSAVADIKNIGSRYGSMMVAGLFLKEFVGEANGEPIPWAHLDIAGPAFNEEAPYGYTPKEGTGFGAATLVNFIGSYAS